MSCVLIVEDEDDVREFMELLIANAGYETMVARDGYEALEMMRARRPCLVLLDLQMPRMDGWEFRERQLQDPRLAHVPVVCISAYFDPGDVTRKLGVRCLLKPADFHAVLREVRSACERSF
jgi:CheY-like chemotaxis protein